MLPLWIYMVTENETNIIESQYYWYQLHKSQFSVELWDVAYATDENGPLVNSLC